MALVGEVARQVFRSAVAVLRAALGQVSEGQLARRLIAIQGQARGQPFQAYQAIARQARRAVVAADAVMRGGAGVVPARDLPRVPESPDGHGQILYRLLVRVSPISGGEEIAYAVDVYTSTAQSYSQLTDLASSRVEGLSSRRGTRAAIARLGGDIAVTVEVLSAGRA